MTSEELKQFLLKKQTADDPQDFIGQLLFELSKIEEDSNQAIKNIVIPPAPDVQKIAIEGVSMVAIKGDKGDKGAKGLSGKDGYSPVKFKDYFTKDEINKIAQAIENRIIKPLDGKDGITPVAGKDYPTTESIYNFIKEQIGLFPIPKDGKDGTDGKDGKNSGFPDHEWSRDKTQIRFQNSDGKWGSWSAPLRGKDGRMFSFGGGTSRVGLIEGEGVNKITVSKTAPANPIMGELWIDIS